MLKKLSSRKSHRLWDNVDKCGTETRTTDNSIRLRKDAICMPDN